MTTTPPSFKKLPRLATPSAPAVQNPSTARQLPNGRLGLGELRSAVKAGLLDTVVLALPNPQGQLKGKRYGARHFMDRVAEGGAEMCKYILATDIDMTPHEGFDLTSWNSGYEDVAVVPDLKTLRRVPWMLRTALVLGDAVGPDEQPLDVAPRQMLRDQLTQLAAHGLHAQVGLETEFVLYRGTYTKTTPVGPGGLVPVAENNLDYALDHAPALDRYFRRLQGALARAGMPVEAIKTEGAQGQIEITFPYGAALSACDRHLVFKHAVRTLAGRAGMTATFMASPETGVASGLHIHVSLTRSGNAMLPTPDGELSLIGERAVAGLLSALPALAPLYAPNVNSYKRYVPGSFAPTRMTWGFDNRTCAVRVVGHGNGLHLEVRLAGAFSDHVSVSVAVDLCGDVAQMSGTVGWPQSRAGSLSNIGPLSPPCLPRFEDLDFEVSDAFVGKPVVGAGAFKPFLERAVFLSELLDAAFESCVLRDEGLNGFAGDQLLSVADLPHQLTNLLSLGVYFLLRAGQLCFGVQRPLSPGGFDPVVGLFGGSVVTALAGDDSVLDQAAGVGVVVEERRRHVRPVSDGPDGEAAAFATQLSNGLLDLAELDLCLPAAGSDGCLGLVGFRGHGWSS